MKKKNLESYKNSPCKVAVLLKNIKHTRYCCFQPFVIKIRSELCTIRTLKFCGDNFFVVLYPIYT